MQPRDRLTAKEVQVATLVWQGLTNKDVAAVLRTSEQVVKNYLRTAFDKLGVWTRLELALYVAGHGGANWHVPPGNGLMPPASEPGIAALEVPHFSEATARDRAPGLGNPRPSASGGHSSQLGSPGTPPL
jgi:DNA-binding CsgD family transcriptional regulator